MYQYGQKVIVPKGTSIHSQFPLVSTRARKNYTVTLQSCNGQYVSWWSGTRLKWALMSDVMPVPMALEVLAVEASKHV